MDKAGLFEKADGGTLLLDELNSMPLALQTKLLRVLQEKRVCRLGSCSEIPVDVRIVSVLNEPPLDAVERGVLRLDLFYRLAVVGLEIPPLRERRDDIPILANSFVETSDLRAGHRSIRFSDEVFQQFLEYVWPGNIRELAHVIECCLVMLGSEDVITDSCLPPHFRKAHRNSEHAPAPAASTASVSAETHGVRSYFDYAEVKRGEVIPLKQCMNAYERRCIQNVLRVTGGNVAKAARIFKMTAAGLRYRIKTLDISNGY